MGARALVAALLCLAFGSIPAKADEQEAVIMLLALGDGAYGVLNVPMHVDTQGLPAVVVVHDVRGRIAGADHYIERLLALGVTVLEVWPFRHKLGGVATLALEDDLRAARQVTAATEVLAMAEGLNPRAIGVLGFGAGARAVLLSDPGWGGQEPVFARVQPRPGRGS